MSKSKAASIGDVQFTQNGEPKKVVSEVELNAHKLGADEPKVEKSQWVIFKLVSNSKRGRLHLDGTDDVYNPETKKMERMRLITGHPSIWVKDQKDLQQDYINSNRRSFIFEDRVLRLPAWDEQAIDFLRLTRHYIDNPNRKTGSKHEFFEWNPQKQAEASMREEMLVVDAMGVAFQASGEKMRKHALFLGIQFSDELGEIKSDEAIKRDYLLYAKNNAKRFMETIDSPLVEVKYLVTKAIRDSKIDIGREKNKAYFANGGGFIISIPQGSRPVDVLSEFATNGTEEGKDFLNNLRKVIN